MNSKSQLNMANEVRARLGLPPLTSLSARDPRAVAKLTKTEHCEIAAFLILGVPIEIVAVVFDVTERTVTRIRSADSFKYPHVAQEISNYEYSREFCVKYITENREAQVRDLYPEYKGPH
jgi:hypothetical protein